MNPQCGYYKTGQRQQYNSTAVGYNQGAFRQQTYGGTGAPRRLGTRTCAKMQPTGTRPCGFSNQGAPSRAPPVFPTTSSGNCGGRSASQGYPAQSSSWNMNRNGNGMQSQQQRMGGAIPISGNNYQMSYQQPQQCAQQQHPLAPAPFCTPQAIKVNVTADQLQNAKNTPYFNNGEANLEANSGAKYIQLNWQDLLGGMDNLRVCMAPSGDPSNQNQQLKVSFGGQKTDPPQAGETNLKVLSIEPVNSGRMDVQQGNALAGSMKICNSPITNVVPNNNARMQRPQQSQQYYAGGNYRQNGSGPSGSCRK